MEKAMNAQEPNPADIIWGARAIGAAVGLSARAAFHALETGKLKGARKIGARWVITHRALMANFEEAHIAREFDQQKAAQREMLPRAGE